ncbi:MAG TPA: biotin-dependent carboxyltransferase family protein, partial [Gemmataceae bacterium]|nr:biotin-dependent carboxyltransferase family protein [Gemmataceae bacterium]
MSLRVLEPGLQTLVVDLGRPSYRSLGVPVGGAADRWSLNLGNALVGNPPDAAALEICLAGPTLQAGCDLGCVVFGAPFEAFRGKEPIAVGHTFTLHRGEIIRIAGASIGLRAYFCVHDGLREPIALGSRSSFDPVRRGQDLACEPSEVSRRFIDAGRSSFTGGELILRAMPGPQAGWFDLGEFFGPTFTVRADSDRMGTRLQGKPLTKKPGELVSEPVSPGAVQVVNDGQCIVLGVDGQTIGGYPKVAHVIAADLDRLGQLRPGQQVRFELVCIDVAENAYRARMSQLHEWMTRLNG